MCISRWALWGPEGEGKLVSTPTQEYRDIPSCYLAHSSIMISWEDSGKRSCLSIYSKLVTKSFACSRFTKRMKTLSWQVSASPSSPGLQDLHWGYWCPGGVWCHLSNRQTKSLVALFASYPGGYQAFAASSSYGGTGGDTVAPAESNNMSYAGLGRNEGRMEKAACLNLVENSVWNEKYNFMYGWAESKVFSVSVAAKSAVSALVVNDIKKSVLF